MTSFARRHVGRSDPDQRKMLAERGFGSLDELIDAAVPPAIRAAQPLALPAAVSAAEATRELREIAAANTVLPSMIGLGHYDTIAPALIRRNVLENPAWYTAYTRRSRRVVLDGTSSGDG